MADAERLLAEVMEASRRTLGPQNLWTLNATADLAYCYLVQGKLSQAEPLAVRALELSRIVVDEDNPGAIWSLDVVTQLYEAQGKLSEAKRMAGKLLAARRRVEIEEHRKAGKSAEGLAWSLSGHGSHAEAETVCQEGLAALAGLPKDSPSIRTSDGKRRTSCLPSPGPCSSISGTPRPSRRFVWRSGYGKSWPQRCRRRPRTGIGWEGATTDWVSPRVTRVSLRRRSALSVRPWRSPSDSSRNLRRNRAYKGTLALRQNNLAWLLATCLDEKLREPGHAVELAKKSVELSPKNGTHWNTLGVAHYRSSDWMAAIEALTKSMELRKGGDANDWLFLAMAHSRLGDKTQSRSWFDKAVSSMEKNQPNEDEELIRFRAEAAALLAANERKD